MSFSFECPSRRWSKETEARRKVSGTSVAEPQRVSAKGTARSRRDARWVSIVSANPETSDGLQSYFVGAGMSSRSTSTLRNVDALASEGAIAAVIFPDDFDPDEVIAVVRTLRRTRPAVLAILVTRQPSRIARAIDSKGQRGATLVLPRPSFGWEILDAIRAHASEVKD